MSPFEYPPLKTGAKVVVLSDWDGTITDRDSNDYLTDNLGFGPDKRRGYNLDVLNEKIGFRDSFIEQISSVAAKHSFDECVEFLAEHINLDPGFEKFYNWCSSNGVPVVIVSSGMAPIIRAVLSKHMPEAAKEIDIIANDVKFTDPEGKGTKGHWELVFRHPESHYGHDKSLAILPYRDLDKPPVLVFCGDGVSDLSAAKHADLLFAKERADGESDLMVYCTRNEIPFVQFLDFHKVEDKVKELVDGKTFPQILHEERS
ncbi:HAD-like domain-containing protein [Kockovaella imperatae]|uniref:HAD-like domain-containing protein n=1 Tax=Kockovaella imperatae TaxID=4999 RepID=A0A1Y1ULA3_9TREE|nr:HAD-like domain-containing protein [Kockovaella imperatae]ORX38337.1 HAD-like domain-containing protein [Kockovaella imperatae]